MTTRNDKNMDKRKIEKQFNSNSDPTDTKLAQDAIMQGRRRYCFDIKKMPNHEIQQIPKNAPNPTYCPDLDLHGLYHRQILGDGGVGAGDDYYHDLFSTTEENIRRAGMVPGVMPTLFSSFPDFGSEPTSGPSGIPLGPLPSMPPGYVPPPPPAVAGPTSTKEFGVYDTYIYFNSFFKDGTSNIAQGELKFSVVALNYNKPIDNIIQMQIGAFYIPDIVLPNYQPEFFFYKRAGILINEMTTQSIFGTNNFRFHFEFQVEQAGISKQLFPINQVFTFGKPVRDFTQVTFQFFAPLKPIPFQVDTFTITSLSSTSNPGFNGSALQFSTNLPHNLGSGGFVAPPSAGAITPANGGAGVLTGTYSWIATFTTFTGETNANFSASPTSIVLTADQAILSTIPLGPAGTTGRNIYRTFANGTTYFLVANIPDNTTTVYVDNNPDSALGAELPVSNTTSDTATFAGYITNFNSGTAFDAAINTVNGYMFTVLDALTVQMDPRANITPGIIPAGSIGNLGIGVRRIAFHMRFRSLAENITNRITPI